MSTLMDGINPINILSFGDWVAFWYATDALAFLALVFWIGTAIGRRLATRNKQRGYWWAVGVTAVGAGALGLFITALSIAFVVILDYISIPNVFLAIIFGAVSGILAIIYGFVLVALPSILLGLGVGAIIYLRMKPMSQWAIAGVSVTIGVVINGLLSLFFPWFPLSLLSISQPGPEEGQTLLIPLFLALVGGVSAALLLSVFYLGVNWGRRIGLTQASVSLETISPPPAETPQS